MSMRVRVKICGITNPADAELAASLGADAIGLNFYTNSPRFVSSAKAFEILNVLPPFVEPVALFVNEPLSAILQIAGGLTIRTVQLHGDTVRLHGILQKVVPTGRTRWIPAFSVRDANCLTLINQHLFVMGVDPLAGVLVDAYVPGMFGGTGQVAPWQLLAEYRPGVPLILAGGLTPENVAEAIRTVRPYAVDVASGVESSPGKKDPEKMRRFIDAVRECSVL
jgi:phosphoribosylanthranilate isomerase